MLNHIRLTEPRLITAKVKTSLFFYKTKAKLKLKLTMQNELKQNRILGKINLVSIPGSEQVRT